MVLAVSGEQYTYRSLTLSSFCFILFFGTPWIFERTIAAPDRAYGVSLILESSWTRACNREKRADAEIPLFAVSAARKHRYSFRGLRRGVKHGHLFRSPRRMRTTTCRDGQ